MMKKNSLFIMKSVLALILSVVIGYCTIQSVHAAPAAAPYTTAEINAKLQGGVGQAIDWDRDCYNNLRARRAAGDDPTNCR